MWSGTMKECAIARRFINHISRNYEYLKNKYRKFCQEKQYQWDEDIFSDTILKCYDAINRKGGLNDDTPQGFEDYFFRSVKQNIQRERQYCRVAKRDMNITSDVVNDLYENYYNSHFDSSTEKLKKDLYVDFATLYIMAKVEENFDNEHFHLFKLKMLLNLTYKQLQEKTQIKGARQKVLEVRNWLRENIKKEDIQEQFTSIYGELL